MRLIYAVLLLFFVCLSTTTNATKQVSLSYGIYSTPADPNKPSEDAYAILKDDYFGVFDGHKGSYVSRYLAKNLLPLIEKKIACAESAKEIRRGIGRAFSKIDNDMRRNPKTPARSGAPGAVVVKKNSEFYVTHIGSTRAFVLPKKSSRFWVSRNHAVSDPREMDRIKREHGIIHNGTKTSEYAIVDNCSGNFCKVHKRASRSFGDFYLDEKGSLVKPKGLSVAPDITKFHEHNIRAIVIVTDGVWRPYGDKDGDLAPLKNLLKGLFKSKMPPEKIAQSIVETVREKVIAEKQKLDDMTVLVIKIA